MTVIVLCEFRGFGVALDSKKARKREKERERERKRERERER